MYCPLFNPKNNREKKTVKAQFVYPKNPSQQAAVLMLGNHTEFFEHLKDKELNYILVDGAHDENPTELDTQFLWTERHATNSKTCTIVITHHSSGSHLNRIELQNGCLALVHSHLFIPATLYGHNYNEKGLDSVKLDAARKVLKKNRVDGAPSSDTPNCQPKGAKINMLFIFRNIIQTC